MTHTTARTLALALTLLTAVASAGSKQGPKDEQLLANRNAVRYEVAVPDSGVKAGAARVHVRASLNTVRKAVADLGNYAAFISKFKKSKVLARSKKHVDVYLEVPILKGTAKVWAVVRVTPAKKVGDSEVIVGKMLQGNVERLEATWRLRSLGEHSTILDLELLIVPKIPVPNSLVTGEVAYAADKAVTGLRNRAEALSSG
jgi:ribosome-associated toxin RatA of RatAB toxin-antitoxin module